MVIVVLGLLAVLVGAMSQRLTGMGFALIVAPFMVLLFGPISGVMLVNLCGAVSAAIVCVQTYRHAEWRTAWRLMAFAAVGVVAGAWLGAVLDDGLMQIVIGILIIIAMSASLFTPWLRREIHRTLPVTGATGLTAGFMNAAAGVGGPAISVYAVLTRWEQKRFAATMQPVLIMMGISSLAFKLLFEADAWPQLPGPMWLGIALCIGAGQLIGERLARIVPVRVARILMITLAYAGGVAALIGGIVHVSG
ncbi:sulfite exporter TauE/SafE family protein [Sediminivirga luteola]|jgi:uncharacterized membrane protein YfcA|uniref:Probable membrane transporter protein n=1 Tax=Sediminivirga luteola TaxID=1774748 RepID=A0A8J2XC47_9MICO|nr:sulfite exporter TauE/SafE family protein [Sediminivirga luteola]MCI2265969.1 sulfite exporter TauE/SafE family protein [Sediminivirga luteola]GGA03463.1 hypothetical protein GCM10011333_02740 [Sediminivirga luteola]